MTDFQDAAGDAHAAVRVPPSVIDLLVGLRTFLQDKCEPPVYVSDRRFMKAVALLQVAAHADGRDEVSEVDCLLLEHVFGQRPDDAHKVRARVLDVIGSDPGLTQAELVLLALFGRAARVLGGGGADAGDDAAGAKADADALVDLLRLRHAALASTLDGGFADLKATVWLSAPAARAAAQALAPPLEEARAKASDLLREAMLVSECLGAGKPGVLERVLPKRAKQYAKGVAERA
jgi:MoxR-like ATPase